MHAALTLRLAPCPSVSMYGTQIPSSPPVKYLGITPDRRLTRAQHIRSKRHNLNHRLRSLNTYINNNKQTHINSKLEIYKSLIKPVWTHVVRLWGYAKKSSINEIQSIQNAALGKLLNARPYVSNATIHSNLKLRSVHDETEIHYKRFFNRFSSNNNPLILNVAVPFVPGDPPRRLQRKWCRDLLSPPI